MAEKVFIENDGALFRGVARGLPDEVWHAGKQQFVAYKSEPKPVDWGEIVDEDRAREIMFGDDDGA